MARRRWSLMEDDSFGSKESSSWDAAMADAAQHESVEALRHQIHVERERRSAMQRGDALFAMGLVAFSFGVGFGTGALKLRKDGK